MLDTFRSSSNLINTFTKHTNLVYSIDYSTFDDCQLICSGSADKTVRVWNVDNNEQIQSFNKHSDSVNCVKFSQYHYNNNNQNVICSSSFDSTIRFWDFKDNKQLQIFNEHINGVCGIEFSSFNGGRYLCSGSFDKTIRLWDVETSKSLHVFNGHEDGVLCVDISPLQSKNKNDNKISDIGVIGGNGYTICSGSFDNTIRIWDIETAKQLNVFEGHVSYVNSVKYGSNELMNTILSGSYDKSVRLWDIRSGQQIQVFNEHTDVVWSVEYSPLVIKNNRSNSNAICSGSWDNTIRFWDIRSNENELHMIKGDYKNDRGITCLKFIVCSILLCCLKKLKKLLSIFFKEFKSITNENCIDFFYFKEHEILFKYLKYQVFSKSIMKKVLINLKCRQQSKHFEKNEIVFCNLFYLCNVCFSFFYPFLTHLRILILFFQQVGLFAVQISFSGNARTPYIHMIVKALDSVLT
ncbi:NACHT and WD40 domain protein [Reticulomyxa filosa]|uniref:NACHT and WD40 domain protein n=1 Tax=Reticulomyxa filosa TaxID=46433 RepID=X6P8N2_RETFI|nr:NACHT and WD40 domain protein [Reticulomyxa filosa]|eukprot:ETO34561.1 NACHT and WD40 domain protein [Reticulomyxa filosa]